MVGKGIFIFDILFKMLEKTEINIWLFFYNPCSKEIKKYIECTVHFKIKGDNSVNDTKIK